jgi:hypothetical protein
VGVNEVRHPSSSSSSYYFIIILFISFLLPFEKDTEVFNFISSNPRLVIIKKFPVHPRGTLKPLSVLDGSCLQNKVLQKIRGANIDFHCQTWMLSVFLTARNN